MSHCWNRSWHGFDIGEFQVFSLVSWYPLLNNTMDNLIDVNHFIKSNQAKQNPQNVLNAHKLKVKNYNILNTMEY